MDDSDVSIALFNAQIIDTQLSHRSVVAELPQDIQWDLDISSAITKTQKCIKIVQTASKKKMSKELLNKLDELLDHLQSKIAVKRQVIKSRTSQMTKVASQRLLNSKQLDLLVTNNFQKSPMKSKNSVKSQAKSFVSNVTNRIKSPDLQVTIVPSSTPFPPTNPAAFRRLKAMRSQEKISVSRL